MIQKEQCQRQNVLPPLPQGIHRQGQHVDAVIQILPKQLVLHHLLQIPIGGIDEADIHMLQPRGANGAVGVALQHVQELGLHGQRHLADLVQKQGAALGCGQQPLLAPAHLAGEGALGVAEKLRLQQVFRYGAAVHRHEGAVAATAVGVDVVGHHVLAGAGFSGDENGHVVGGGAPRRFQTLAHPLAHGDDALGGKGVLPQMLRQIHQLPAQILDPVVQQQVVRPVVDVGHNVADAAVGGKHGAGADHDGAGLGGVDVHNGLARFNGLQAGGAVNDLLLHQILHVYAHFGHAAQLGQLPVGLVQINDLPLVVRDHQPVRGVFEQLNKLSVCQLHIHKNPPSLQVCYHLIRQS